MIDEEIKQNANDYTHTNDHNWTWDDSGESRVDISAEVLDAFIAGAHSRDEEVDELKEQHENDRLFVEEAQKRLKFWDEFINYLNEKAIGDKNRIIEAVYGNDLNCFEGYVKVTKTIENGKIMLEFERPSGGKYKAEWQPSDNYACWQTCGIMGDDYSGFLLFPTYKEDEYFCMYYQC